ncbi:MDR family NADP-dependent oxidoreductase [Streptomyces sp. NPDC102467]|uniref:MDR family NADP-dependent oxidoreductase n=1 Tax=Streptomyces sp. NPDC102467 TaxID=3366179 RepID=UPI00382E2D09
MTTALPETTRHVQLAAVPQGLPAPEHFTIVEEALTAPGAGEVLVRNRHFLVFPGLRTLMSGEAEGAPMPQLHRGDALSGPAVGEVVAAPADGPLRIGDLVTHMRGWREYALVPATECTALDAALPDPVASLSPGSAAYGALTRLVGVRDGDVVLVTGAAGAVGSLAGQIARLLGAKRVIGTTGSKVKAERLVAELGYDAVVLRGAGPLADQLAEAAPEGIDVLVDNVAGEQLVAALGVARHGARFALIGALSGQLAADRSGGSAPVEIDAYRLLAKSVSLRGYSGADHPDVEKEWYSRFGGWLRSGEIVFPHARIAGIDRAPQALRDMMEGRHFGAVVVDV